MRTMTGTATRWIKRRRPIGPLSRARVLVVDDDADGCSAMASVLERAGARVRTACSGDEALDVLRTWWATILVTDLAMPGGDGDELLSRLRVQGRGGRLPAVVVTGANAPVDRERTRRAGFSVHLQKPVDPAELVRAVGALHSR